MLASRYEQAAAASLNTSCKLNRKVTAIVHHNTGAGQDKQLVITVHRPQHNPLRNNGA